jgi:hypothetical protein
MPVIIANCMKAVSFVSVFLVLQRYAGDKSLKSPLLINPGDAIAFFLVDLDHHTLGISINHKEQFEKETWQLMYFKLVPITWTARAECSEFRKWSSTFHHFAYSKQIGRRNC